MSYEETISENENYRVKIVLDKYADEPYDDGQAPLVRIDTAAYGSPKIEHIQVGRRPTDDDEWVEELVRRHWHRSNCYELIEKALRGALGTTRVDWYTSRDYTYFAYDTKRVREYWGLLPEVPVQYDMLAEYRAWCEGDVWGWVLEKKVHWTTEDDFTDKDTWEHVDSCYGYYGYEYAEEEARGIIAQEHYYDKESK